MRRFNPEKELYKIQHGGRNKVLYGIILLLLIISIGSTYALYQVRYSKRIIYTKVAPFSNKDIELAVYLDGEPSTDNDFPVKNSGYVYEKTICNNKSTVFFDNVGWNLYLKANKKDKCNVYFITNDSEPNPPELYQGLIPVTFDESGKVLVANPTNNDWYNYDEKRWANAVLVNTTKYNELMHKGFIKEEKYGAEISMSDILQMYVWIPRYKYQLFNVNNVGIEEQEIQIQFENGIDNTGDIECKYTNNKNGTITEKCTKKETEIDAQNDDWYTHPAFTFKGTFDESGTELRGIWVGKFEASGNNTNVRIIPGVSSIVSVNLSYMFYASRNIDETYATNFNLDKEEIDTHQMKNMEWGAMAYLTQSKYGRCDGQGNCTEVTDNNKQYMTGYDDKGNLWNTENGKLASTTGNMYGIYDASGGAWEYVMGNMVTTGGGFNANSSGLTSVDAKYYDAYQFDTNLVTHARGHLGDATRETIKTFGVERGAWYGEDCTYFVVDKIAWFIRGGGAGNTKISLFSFAYQQGIPEAYETFRVVLTAQDGNN